MTFILTSRPLRPELPVALRDAIESSPGKTVVLCYGDAIYGLRSGPPHPRADFLVLAPEAEARGCAFPPPIHPISYAEAVDLLLESDRQISCV